MTKRYAIIVAGGNGTRMLSSIPKQFMILGDQPILMHTIRSFFTADASIEILLALPVDQIHFWKQLCIKYNFLINHQVVEGGKTRFHSVKNALNQIHEKGSIAVHDGVRPLVSSKVILKAFETAEIKGNAIPSVPVFDSIRVLENDKNRTVNRALYRVIQTPQCFTSELLKAAYEQKFQDAFTDDASVVEGIGTSIHLIDGDKKNIKITTSEDLIIAEAFLKEAFL